MSRLEDVRAVAWQGLLSAATFRVAEGAGDDLVVLPQLWLPAESWQTALHQAAQHDDDVSALAAIDVLRILVAEHEAEQGEDYTDPDTQHPGAGELVATCPDHPEGAIQMVETGYTRTWTVELPDDPTGAVLAYDDDFDLESGNGDDHFECSTCLRKLPDVVDFNTVDYS